MRPVNSEHVIRSKKGACCEYCLSKYQLARDVLDSMLSALREQVFSSASLVSLKLRAYPKRVPQGYSRNWVEKRLPYSCGQRAKCYPPLNYENECFFWTGYGSS
jgi:hypothetical protein